MSIEALKEQARRHEQKEEWLKALDQYKKAIARLDAEEQPDIGLYNRVGDLFVRVGKLDDAVTHYERAVDLYLDAELPNNAIAVCKKVIRNVPERHEAYLRMGQIRARQGFVSDARTNFLTYAERMQHSGHIDESFRALVEFCDLVPDEVEVRMAVAEQLASHGRREAVEQYTVAHRILIERGLVDKAAEVEGKVHEIDPSVRMGAEPAAPAARLFEAAATSSVSSDGEIVAEFGEIEFHSPAEAEEEAEEEADHGLPLVSFEMPSDSDEGTGEAADDADALPLPLIVFGTSEDDAGEEDTQVASDLPFLTIEEDDAEEAADPLPLMHFDVEDESEDVEDATPLPFLEEAGTEESADLVTLDASAFGEADHGERALSEYVAGAGSMVEVDFGLGELPEDAREAAFEETAAEKRVEAPTLESTRARIDQSPDDVDLRQRFVELAYASGNESALVEAYLGLGQTLDRAGQAARARAAYQQVIQLAPDHPGARAALGASATPQRPFKEVAAHEDYIDLGSLLLGDDEEKTTRFVVAYEEPTGDDEADFAKMLSQFKEKVSQNLEADDVKAHHDLGTAYKEMGLLDEAVAEFQQALRASSDYLPTYELLGQTFLEMGNPEAAVRSLERAIRIRHDIEDELLGIYYYLARAYEEVGKKDSALEYYDRVFSLDINFADVTERLRALR